MATFLLRDERMGTRSVSRLPDSAFPWAVSAAGQIVYIDCAGDTSLAQTPVTGTLQPYTRALSVQRRRACQSELGDLVLKNRDFTKPAVGAVSLGVIDYVLKALREGKPMADRFSACIGKYMYSASGFGRLGQPSDKPADKSTLYTTGLQTLTQGELPSVLAIHDFMGRVIFAELKGTDGQDALFNSTGAKVRPAHVFGSRSDSSEKIEALRGRTARPDAPGSTRAPGLMPEGVGTDTYQNRERGIDKWMPTQEKAPQSTIDIQQRNLIFGAGPSGSTGTLLQAARLFGNVDGELLRQYVLAIVGYLVGGGMHSYHEVMVIARLVGCPYTDGAYLPSLPATFTRTTAFESWRDTYHDVVVLGGRLWVLGADRPAVGKLDAGRLEAFKDKFKPRPPALG